MEEQILIKSERYNIKKGFVIIFIIGAILSIIIFLLCMFDNLENYDNAYYIYSKHQRWGHCDSLYSLQKCSICKAMGDDTDIISYAISLVFYEDTFFVIPIISFTLIGSIIYLWLHSYELTVTDKRIYGKIAWSKRIDLPVDFISAISTISVLNGISVSTSSGRINFRVIKNVDEIYKVINSLLIERQQNKLAYTVTAPTPLMDITDQLKQYKDLLDNNLITQEDYEAKKKQLLGL